MGTVQYSTRQYSTVQHSTVQYSTLQHSTAQYSTVQYSTVQYSTVQYSTVQYKHSSIPSYSHCTAHCPQGTDTIGSFRFFANLCKGTLKKTPGISDLFRKGGGVSPNPKP